MKTTIPKCQSLKLSTTQILMTWPFSLFSWDDGLWKLFFGNQLIDVLPSSIYICISWPAYVFCATLGDDDDDDAIVPSLIKSLVDKVLLYNWLRRLSLASLNSLEKACFSLYLVRLTRDIAVIREMQLRWLTKWKKLN